MPDVKRPGRLAAVIGLVGLPAFLAGVPAPGDNWPRFRGPDAGVVGDDPDLPDRWSRLDNVRWRLEVPGLAWSSPVIWGELVFITSVIGDEPRPEPGLDRIDDVNPVDWAGGRSRAPSGKPYRWMLYAIEFETGRIRWARELHTGVPSGPKHLKNTYASATPVTDGERVYVHFGDVGLFAVDFAGRIVWSQLLDLPPLPGDSAPLAAKGLVELEKPLTAAQIDAGVLSGLGWGSSPTLHRDRLFIQADHEAQQWFVAAYSVRDGRQLWRVNERKPQSAYGWATPFVWENERRTELIAAGGRIARSYDPASGQLLWQLSGLSGNTVPTPFAAHRLLYLASGYPVGETLRPVFAIRPGAAGDISLQDGQTSSASIAWSDRNLAAYLASSLVYRNYHFTVLVNGFLNCNHALTGERVYFRKRISPDASNFTASPWAYNGKLFVLSEEGDTYVIDAGPEFRVLGKNSLGEMVQATPAVVRGSVIIRTVAALYRIAKPA